MTTTTPTTHHHHMARETSKRTKAKPSSKAHCSHCGHPATLDSDGNVKPHEQATGSTCPGTGYPPLA